MKCVLWISMVAVTVFALPLDTFAQFDDFGGSGNRGTGSKNKVDKVGAQNFAKAAASRAQPVARAEAQAIMRAEAERRKLAGEKAPSFMGYELGMMQSDIDKKAVWYQEDRKPGKVFVAGRNTYTGYSKDIYLDAEKKYPVRSLQLKGDGKNIIQMSVFGDSAGSMQRMEWQRYATALVEQKTGRKPDVVDENNINNYAKWNAKTYEVDVCYERGGLEIRVRTKSDHDPKKVKPGI